jgi:hypothetical protein
METILVPPHVAGRDANEERRLLQEQVRREAAYLPPSPQPRGGHNPGGPYDPSERLFNPGEVARTPDYLLRQANGEGAQAPAPEPTAAERIAVDRRNRIEQSWAKRWREDILQGLSRPPVHETFAGVADAVRAEVAAADARIADEWKLGQAQRELERIKGWISELTDAQRKQHEGLAAEEARHEKARQGAKFPFKTARTVAELEKDVKTTADQLLEVEAHDKVAAHQEAVADLHHRMTEAAAPVRDDLARQLAQEKKEIAAFLAERLVRIERLRKLQEAYAPMVISQRHGALVANLT